MVYTDQDVKDLAYCAWMEARGEGISGCVLIMQVIYNRVQHANFPKTIHTVVYQPNAFSWTRPDDPEYGKQPPAGDAVYAACLADAPNILAGTNSDLTKGAVYYANEAVTGQGWYRTHIINSPDHPITFVYGHHTFRS